MLVNALLLATPLLLGTGPDDGPGARDVVFLNARHVRSPSVAVWTNRDEVIRRGQSVRVFFEAESDAYVTVFRIDTDGRVEVLFPQGPWDNNFARGAQPYEVRTYGDRSAFRGDDYPGAGYVFAVTSLDPFDYAAISRGARWDYRNLGYRGRIVGDPYVAVTDLIDLILPPGYDAYDYDVMHYYVDRRVDYPRFLCYDCHAYASYAEWNPYHDPCFRFRIVVYNDPYYYPLRAYGGSRVVFTRPKRLEPRFVFIERAGSRRDVVVESRRPVNDPGPRRTIDRPVTSRQFGGVGAVPTPNRHRAPESSGRRNTARDDAGNNGGRRPIAQPTSPNRSSAGAPGVPRRVNGGREPASPNRSAPATRRTRPTLQTHPSPRRVQAPRRSEAGAQPQAPPGRAGGDASGRRVKPPSREPTPPKTSASPPGRRTGDPRRPPRRRSGNG